LRGSSCRTASRRHALVALALLHALDALAPPLERRLHLVFPLARQRETHARAARRLDLIAELLRFGSGSQRRQARPSSARCRTIRVGRTFLRLRQGKHPLRVLRCLVREVESAGLSGGDADPATGDSAGKAGPAKLPYTAARSIVASVLEAVDVRGRRKERSPPPHSHQLDLCAQGDQVSPDFGCRFSIRRASRGSRSA